MMQLTPTQQAAVTFITNHDVSFLCLDTGQGKTAIILHAIKRYLDAGLITQAIVCAPASVIGQFPVENHKWRLALNVQALAGAPSVRSAIIESKPDVIVVSLNNLESLLEHELPATMVAVDELTKAAGRQTRRLRTKKWKDQLKIRVGTTASPVSENFEKLFGMVRILDNGHRLGRVKQTFMDRYFTALDFKGYRHELRPNGDTQIMEKIKDIIFSAESDKHLTLPPVVESYAYFNIPESTSAAYSAMKKDMLLETVAGDVVGTNMAVVSGKLRQLASGFAITEDGDVMQYDMQRACTAFHSIPKGETALVLYQYEHQRYQLETLLHKTKTAYVYGGSDKTQAMADFKEGRVRVLVAQESTISHGVDGLQHVCNNLIFMQPPWSADIKIQAIGRLHRTGQKKTVNVITVMANKSLDALVEERQESKSLNMKSFINHLKGTT